MVILLLGLWYVQVISYRHYAENQKAQSFRTVRIPAIRGKILDRNGVALAENSPSYNVALYLDELREHFQQEYARIRPRRCHQSLRSTNAGWAGKREDRIVKLTSAQRQQLSRMARYRVVSNIVHRLSLALGQPVTLQYDKLSERTTRTSSPCPSRSSPT